MTANQKENIMDRKKLLEELRGIRRIVINSCYGGFGMSQQALIRYKELVGDVTTRVFDIPRDDPYLVQVVRELGEDAAGPYAELKILEIPADVNWEIEEYDGKEWVAERHRVWE